METETSVYGRDGRAKVEVFSATQDFPAPRSEVFAFFSDPANLEALTPPWLRFEVLKGTNAVATLIRDNKTYQIPSLMQIGQNLGMRTFDEALLQLVRDGRVSPEVAYMKATTKDIFEPLVSPRFLEELLA